MKDELTTEQINRGLAKWHSERHKYGMKFTAGACLVGTSECGTCVTFPLYTVSLDTMRLIEALFSLEQKREYGHQIKALHCWTWDQSAFWIICATAEQRARAAFTVLGLKIEVSE